MEKFIEENSFEDFVELIKGEILAHTHGIFNDNGITDISKLPSYLELPLFDGEYRKSFSQYRVNIIKKKDPDYKEKPYDFYAEEYKEWVREKYRTLLSKKYEDISVAYDLDISIPFYYNYYVMQIWKILNIRKIKEKNKYVEKLLKRYEDEFNMMLKIMEAVPIDYYFEHLKLYQYSIYD